MRHAAIAACLVGLAGCQTPPPLSSAGADPALTPAAALAHWPDTRGAGVLWGGAIVQTVPRGEWTEIEVLAFPLGADQRPDTRAPALGRFFLRANGLLEPLDFAPGRLITVRGSVIETGQGTIGQAVYRFPVIAAAQFYLWPATPDLVAPVVRFGIGISF